MLAESPVRSWSRLESRGWWVAGIGAIIWQGFLKTQRELRTRWTVTCLRLRVPRIEMLLTIIYLPSYSPLFGLFFGITRLGFCAVRPSLSGSYPYLWHHCPQTSITSLAVPGTPYVTLDNSHVWCPRNPIETCPVRLRHPDVGGLGEPPEKMCHPADAEGLEVLIDRHCGASTGHSGVPAASRTSFG